MGIHEDDEDIDEVGMLFENRKVGKLVLGLFLRGCS